jgi:hypothetical protein
MRTNTTMVDVNGEVVAAGTFGKVAEHSREGGGKV